NARSFLWAWLSARAQGGRVLLRIEDLDTPRVKPGAVEAIEEDLRWIGLDWDGPVEIQSRRRARYAGDFEPRYPGTCRDRAPDRVVAWRLKVPPGPVAFEDRLTGRHEIDVASTVG